MLGVGIDGCPWRENSLTDYDDACDVCEMICDVAADDHAAIRDILAYDKRKDGNRGLCLTQPYRCGLIDLEVGDRLEPSATMLDVGLFLSGAVHFPVRCVFWRKAMETLTRHRNPLFDQRLGMECQRILVVDSLHALYLGVMLVFCRHGIWLLVTSGMFGRGGNQEENVQIAVLVFKGHLKRFYKWWHNQNPDRPLTRITDVTPKMIGDKNDMKCKTKGAETWGLLLFMQWIFRLYGAALPQLDDFMEPAAYLEAADAVVELCRIMDTSGCNIPHERLDRMLFVWKRFSYSH